MRSHLAARRAAFSDLLWARGHAFARHWEARAGLAWRAAVFGDLHQDISRSWKQPFSSRLTNAAAADFTNLVGSEEQGYTAMPVVEDTLATHLSPSLAPSWKSRPSFRSSHVGPLPPLSGSPTSRPVRQAWPSTRWPSFKPTRRTCLKRWTRGLAWLQRLWKSCAKPLTWLSEPLSTPHVPWGALWRVQWPQNAICGVEGEGVLAGLTHLTVWVIWGGG